MHSQERRKDDTWSSSHGKLGRSGDSQMQKDKLGIPGQSLSSLRQQSKSNLRPKLESQKMQALFRKVSEPYTAASLWGTCSQFVWHHVEDCFWTSQARNSEGMLPHEPLTHDQVDQMDENKSTRPLRFRLFLEDARAVGNKSKMESYNLRFLERYQDTWKDLHHGTSAHVCRSSPKCVWYVCPPNAFMCVTKCVCWILQCNESYAYARLTFARFARTFFNSLN